ncbi:bifunctional arginine demethylase and lysyl-hydroxylase JMJD6-B [Anoplophora glabripennis]|uniref:bifunctional arginine demethylase and lysyl-hydroxylase JMJD6-B n=1 Tax=Anoplophora glabripennis TaxID=217634 RepID=UPI0008742C1F|nr:bifunctional arginine demethylase and lysyl-hydroxylase JMJD6-B [Anoplophora glabripennis]
MNKVEERLNSILRKAENSSEITTSHFSKLDVTNKLVTFSFFDLNQCKIKFSVLVLVLGHLLYKSDIFNSSDECFLEMPSDASKIFREPESCDICNNIDQVDKVVNISALDFYEKYARMAKPLVVNDGAVSWPAIKVFDFEFFKDLYNSIDTKQNSRRNCQFFPYKTEFKSLEEVFEMKIERSILAPGEKSWYVGWNNCNDEAGKILQQYYEKPYFLSNNSENIAMSWIFMGGPGHGAHMHVDNVHYPSWQAQLRGKKLWKLAPPPECLYKCKTFEVVVEPGEIIVVDTNRWYHQTFILPGEISITIGSEFD